MRCHCGSVKFTPLGIQEAIDPISGERIGKDLYLINCSECGTTISASKTFYTLMKYLEAQDSVDQIKISYT